jgi:hypothetical protein
MIIVKPTLNSKIRTAVLDPNTLHSSNALNPNLLVTPIRRGD